MILAERDEKLYNYATRPEQHHLLARFFEFLQLFDLTKIQEQLFIHIYWSIKHNPILFKNNGNALLSLLTPSLRSDFSIPSSGKL